MTLAISNDMKIVAALLLLSGFTMLSLAYAQVSDDAKLEFSSLELDQTNRGSININGYDRYFSVTFPTSYDRSEAYPVVLFFHGCMCRPHFTEQSIKSYLYWSP